MEFLNWKNLLSILFGGILAGLLLGGYKAYEQHRKEEIAEKLYLAEELLYKNQTAEAEKLASEIPPPAVGYLYLRLGDYYASRRKLDKAFAEFKNAAEVFNSTDKPLHYFSLERAAYILYRKGDYKKSLQLLDSLLDDIPNFCEVQLLKAENYAALGDYTRLTEIANRIVQSCPDKTIRMTVDYLVYKYRGKGEIKPVRSE